MLLRIRIEANSRLHKKLTKENLGNEIGLQRLWHILRTPEAYVHPLAVRTALRSPPAAPVAKLRLWTYTWRGRPPRPAHGTCQSLGDAFQACKKLFWSLARFRVN